MTLSAVRPALAEAKLLTRKLAQDEVYLVTLAEELRSIERRVAAAESDLQIATVEESCGQQPDLPDAAWIQEKSVELNRRLHRIEKMRERQRL